MTIEWAEVAKTAPGIIGAVSGIVGTITGGLALYFNRRDARRSAEASRPTATMLLNLSPEADGWYLIKFTFLNVSRSFDVESVKLIDPRKAKIARRVKINEVMTREGDGAQQIDVQWRLDPPRETGVTAGFAHLNIRLKDDSAPTAVRLVMRGHYVSGVQAPISIECLARR